MQHAPQSSLWRGEPGETGGADVALPPLPADTAESGTTRPQPNTFHNTRAEGLVQADCSAKVQSPSSAQATAVTKLAGEARNSTSVLGVGHNVRASLAACRGSAMWAAMEVGSAYAWCMLQLAACRNFVSSGSMASRRRGCPSLDPAIADCPSIGVGPSAHQKNGGRLTDDVC